MTSFGTSLALVTATASAVTGGVFVGFSTLVMPAGYAVAAAPSGRGWLLVGAVAGLASMALAAGYHLPYNDALAKLDPHGPQATATWAAWAAAWTTLNSVRAAADVLSAVALVVGAWRGR